ncbi:MAG: hypothetical protein HPY84_02560 [Syntrophobacteraceae bacterium]|jgi:Fe-S cluster assembly iron-binding protein IscA|nr:hypothetical protein [Syntrophobacteraceae bacterium]
MVLDEPTEADDVFKVNSFTMVIEKELHKQTKDITVDYVNYGMGSGFKLTPEVAVGGGGCGSTSCHC